MMGPIKKSCVSYITKQKNCGCRWILPATIIPNNHKRDYLILWLEICFVPTTKNNGLVTIWNVNFEVGSHYKLSLHNRFCEAENYCFSIHFCPLLQRERKKGPPNFLFASFLLSSSKSISFTIIICALPNGFIRHCSCKQYPYCLCERCLLNCVQLKKKLIFLKLYLIKKLVFNII